VADHFPEPPNIDEITVSDYLRMLPYLAILLERSEAWAELLAEIERRMGEACDRTEEITERFESPDQD